ncbi:MAG: 50S ribosomal protein L35 [Deltaproteobacteria bacterium]|nr:50S ribosomal protein L35 [Deltaproteobacteria bacterium]
MPRLKTNRGAAKRFRFTKSGKIKRARSKRRHILTSKATKTKRRLRMPGIVKAANATQLKRLLPYGSS